MRSLTESEWKIFRKLQETALERYCERVLAEARECVDKKKKTSHQRYLDLFKLLRDHDKNIASAFNDPRRSDAYRQLMMLVSLKLLSTEEFGRFSEETRTSIEQFIQTMS